MSRASAPVPSTDGVSGDRPVATKGNALTSLALWAVAAALGARMLAWLWEAVREPSHSFVSHYTASRLVLEGADVARFYDDAWFMAQVARFEPTIVDIYLANLPTTSLLLVPLAPLEYHTARVVWTFLSVVALVACVLWAARLGGVRPGWTAAIFCLVFLFQPVHANLFHGTMYVMALALLVVVWWAWRSDREGIAGGTLGALFVAKTTALMYWPLLAAQRRWKALAWGAGTVVAVVALSLPVVGTDAWATYAERAAALPSEPWLAVTAYQTVPGWIRHLLVHDPRWNPEPIADLPAVAAALAVIAGVGMLGISVTVAWHRRSDLVFGAFAALGLVLTPVSADSHYTVALLPIVILTSRLQDRMRSAEGLLLVAGALLVAADLPYGSPRVTGGWWALLAYPKLYGALVLWALSLRLAVDPAFAAEPGGAASSGVSASPAGSALPAGSAPDPAGSVP